MPTRTRDPGSEGQPINREQSVQPAGSPASASGDQGQGKEPEAPRGGGGGSRGEQRANVKSVYQHRIPGTYLSGSREPHPQLHRELVSLHWVQTARPGALYPPPPKGGLLAPRRKWPQKKILPADPELQDSCYPGKREVPLGSQLPSRQAPPGPQARPLLWTLLARGGGLPQ